MPYADIYKRKKWKKEYYQKNKDRIRAYECRKKAYKKYRQNNKSLIRKKERDKYDPKKAHDIRERYKETINSNFRKGVEELTEKYIIRQLKKDDWTIEEIKQYPELISIKRILLKTKRLCKTSQNSAKA